MRRNRSPYSPEFRQKMVDLVRAGRRPEELAKEFEPTVHSIRKWVTQAGIEGVPSVSGISLNEQSELTQLRRENRILREEREILKKAAAWFAQESGSSPRRSDS